MIRLGLRRGLQIQAEPANSGKTCKPRPSPSPAAEQGLEWQRLLAGQRAADSEKPPHARHPEPRPVSGSLGLLPAKKGDTQRDAWLPSSGSWGERSGMFPAAGEALSVTYLAPVD